jgi:hypothetical protein
MAPEDRDPVFEKALARHLRAKPSSPGAPAEAEKSLFVKGASVEPGCSAADSSAAESSVDVACPNPEVLAAYHERLLAAEEMVTLKKHFASCDRCQEILSALEATDDLLLPSDRTADEITNNVLAMPAPHVEIPAEIVTVRSSPGPVAMASRASRRAQSSWRSKTLHGANWKWLAPVGAIAAILLLWVSFHESHPSTFELAKNTEPAAAATTASTATRATTPAGPNKELADRAKLESSAAPRSQADVVVRDESRKGDRLLPDDKKSVDRVVAKPSAPQVTAANPATPQRDRDSNELGLAAKSRNDAPSESKEATASAAAPAPSAAEPPRGYVQKQNQEEQNREEANKDAVAGVQSEVVTPSKSESVTKAKTASGRQAPEQDKQQRAAGNVVSLQSAEALAPGPNGPMLRAAKTSAANVFSAPNNAALWRVRPAGIIEHSTDSGATWEVQSSGVVSDLLTGSAPTRDICWIVGGNGTILRTTDAGAHWEKVNPPATVDLTSIFAVNAQQVTVSTTPPLKSYRTTDAGKTWTQIPNP